jgi:serine phosphatase RsbU (regulator of sigma subunit)
MLAALRGREAESPAVLLEALREDVARFTAGAEQSDDLTLLGVRWNGPSSGR